MAASGGVWGIDIGQCGLKALRCRLSDDGRSLVAEAFDFIEYPKILSQPDAEPKKLIREALKQFLSRNSVRGSKVAISVSGQSGLARFIKLPPVESKKIPDIVKYEARQQIPFALDDVVWDYQQMPGGSEEDGFALETEVGLFAMKRDQVFRTIEPLVDAEVELDIIQLTPLCIYNAVAFDVLDEVLESHEFDAENPPESIVVLSMGTDTSDLVVTNGYRVWQRSIPLGGNHFTKQLMKELKLTFAKAEHLKRNAREAEDPKAVFQAMRSVFSDLVTEVQRSIGYFQNIDKTAKIGRIIILGNAAKLPGLPQYLAKNLALEVTTLNSFNRLTGSPIISSPAFTDNLLSFAVCYGLCLQGVGKAKLSTNLVPREIIVQRLVRRKKPWAAAVAGVLLLACAFHFFFRVAAWRSVHDAQSENGKTWADAKGEVQRLQSQSNTLVNLDKDYMGQLNRLKELGEATVSIADGRVLWLELLTAINQALPRPTDVQAGQVLSPKQRALLGRPEIYIQYIDSQYFGDLSSWCTDEVKKKYLLTLAARQRSMGSANPATETSGDRDANATTQADSGDAAGATADETASADEEATSPSGLSIDDIPSVTGPGWVIEIKLRHYHNDLARNQITGPEYVRSAFLANLVEDATVDLPVFAPDGQQQIETFTMLELGVRLPIEARSDSIRIYHEVDPSYVSASTRSPSGEFDFQAPIQPSEEAKEAIVPARGYECVVQFCWQEQRASQRLEQRRQKQLGASKDLAAKQ